MKDLYATAEISRDLVDARCQPRESSGATLEKYGRTIGEQFFPARGEGKLKLGEARKAIRDYRKATGNVSGAVELLMTYVENGTRSTHEYGDIDERFYSSVESALDELAALLRGEAREIYPKFSDRLAKVEKMPEGIGWGCHDFVADVIGRLARFRKSMFAIASPTGTAQAKLMKQKKPGWYSWFRKSPTLHAAKRIVVAVIGGTVTLIGIALIFLPGPAFIVIPIGLSILATEFLWARRWLKKVRQIAARLTSKSPPDA